MLNLFIQLSISGVRYSGVRTFYICFLPFDACAILSSRFLTGAESLDTSLTLRAVLIDNQRAKAVILAKKKGWDSIRIGGIAHLREMDDCIRRTVNVTRCQMREAELMGANLDVGNIDWSEYKEVDEEKHGGPSV